MCYWNMPCSLGCPPGTGESFDDHLSLYITCTYEDCISSEYGYLEYIDRGVGVW